MVNAIRIVNELIAVELFGDGARGLEQLVVDVQGLFIAHRFSQPSFHFSFVEISNENDEAIVGSHGSKFNLKDEARGLKVRGFTRYCSQSIVDYAMLPWQLLPLPAVQP